MISHQQTILLAGGPADLVSAVSKCVQSVPSCDLDHHAELEHVSDAVLNRPKIGLLLVYAEGRQQRQVVRRLLRQAQQRRPSLPVVVLTEADLHADHGDFLSAGAADCLARPLNLSRLTFLVDFLTLRSRSLGPARKAAPAPVSEELASPLGLVFVSPESRTLLVTAQRLAQVDSTILLSGETGSGKTCIARMIHELSPRRKEPFVVVNCGALPESLLESELFGHRQGAFTGASREHRGKFAQAGAGTIFLDEIDSLSLTAQSSLLRVVADRQYEAIGSGQCEQLHSRLVCATNRDLSGEVEAGRFRRDLYFRLNVVSLAIPPLRERISALPVLVEVFLKQLRSKGATQVERFSAEALQALQGYAWPGNVRELRNVVERLAVLADKPVIEAADLPAEVRSSAVVAAARSRSRGVAVASLGDARRAAERQQIVSTLQLCHDNRSLAAELLGISRTAFYKKLNQLGIA
ncbi:MAG TPA: sigma-54 dependent transcriptional regulator [Pirellulaceae bacterium]|nr:sigma-54 dependent transcriptional regulator [Pirellulaceae bacterium]